ncbi:putative SP-containing protein [Vairimorpha necatrix]|uniref:SP-containing protein n=1 Tax=Vairimorpha necatrix TaxID=6039 RepID=A0AAX4JFV2_9MICR
MFILHVFYMFVSIQAIFKPLYGETTKKFIQKIEGGDYQMLDHFKNGYADLWLKKNKEIGCSFKILDFEKDEKSEIPESLNINCEGKSLDIILNEYERKLIEIMDIYKLYKVFLNYMDADTGVCINLNEKFFFKDIIKGIRKIHDNLNNTNNKNKFLYSKTAYAIENEEGLIFNINKYAPFETEDFELKHNSCVKILRDSKRNMCISALVYTEKACFYFEFSKGEMLDIVNQCLEEKNVIYKKCFDLYKSTFAFSFSDKSVRFFAERRQKVLNTLRQDENCEIIKLLRDELGLLECSENNNTKYKLQRENILESREYAERMQDLMENTEYSVIDAFSILLGKEEIGFLVKRILDKTKDQLNIFFGYILFFDKLIDKEELECLKNKGDLNREKIISKIFNSNRYHQYKYIKVFLFVEAENYINNEIAAEGSFKTLKEIGNIMKDNRKNEDQNEQSSQYLDLVNIMNEVIVKQSENFEVFIILNMTNFIRLLVNSSFTIRTVFANKRQGVDKNKLIKIFDLDPNKVEGDINLIKGKLAKIAEEKEKKINLAKHCF